MIDNIIKVDFAAAMTDTESPRPSGEDNFTLKIGGTYYDISTHFDTEGRQSVFRQFRDLIVRDKLI